MITYDMVRTLLDLKARWLKIEARIYEAGSRDPLSNPLRFDESKAPLAPRSGPPFGGWNPTRRQIEENDLPRYIAEDGTVRTIALNEDEVWV